MTDSVKLTLDGAVEQSPYPPLSKTIELTVTYHSPKPNTIPGEVIAGLQVLTQGDKNFFILHRRNDAALFQVDEGELTFGAFKVSNEAKPELNLCYVIRGEEDDEEFSIEMGVTWQFFLSAEGNTFHLINMADTGGPGATPCEQRVRATCPDPDSLGCRAQVWWTCLLDTD